MAYQRNSMNFNSTSKAAAAQFVDDTLGNLPSDSPWTMTITQGRSGDYSVRTVIDMSSDDYGQEQVASFFSQTQVNT